tara:strand:- start:8341 stop:8496 length:156 start_codon:yes stop_codon:yes gene_type:complete
MNEGYTEYGYRGLEEIKRLEEKIVELKKEIEELRNSSYNYWMKEKNGDTNK